jgi:predicted nucleotidyltransferase
MNTTPGAKPNVPSPIQQTSSASVSVFWLDLDQIRTCLEQAATGLAERHSEIEEIWLFGSLARGDAVPGSDADLFIVLSQSDLSYLDRSAYYQTDFCGVGVDVLAYTRDELSQMQAAESPSLRRRVEAEGVCLVRRKSR